ncbi:MAG: hypothetical protein HC782_04285 [Gammaproteobacteria bacterium]|nr:hypothetical protein [Gammaproteobacteria bacterium]
MRLTSSEVKRLLSHGQRLSVGVQRIAFTARTLSQFAAERSKQQASLAVAVPKRLLKRAIDRNRAKRVLRETFRLHDVYKIPLNTLITLTASPKSGALSRRRLMTTMRVAATVLLGKVAKATKETANRHTSGDV